MANIKDILFPSDLSILPFMFKAPSTSASRQAGLTHHTLQPSGVRMNMTTQDHKKENL